MPPARAVALAGPPAISPHPDAGTRFRTPDVRSTVLEHVDGRPADGEDLSWLLGGAMRVISDKAWLASVGEAVGSASVGSRSGVLAHALIAQNVSTLTAHDAGTAAEVLLTAAERILDLTDLNWSTKNRTRAEAVTTASRYVTRLAPLRATWVGSEIPLDHSIPDLAWWTPGGAFFDEIKTGNIGTRGFGPAALDQAARQASDGHARAGDAFIGVRLIPIRMPHAAVLVTADGRTRALAATAVSIETMRKGI